MYYRVIIILFFLIQCTGARDECIHQLEQKTKEWDIPLGFAYSDRPNRTGCIIAITVANQSSDSTYGDRDLGLFDFALLECLKAELNYRKCKKYPTDLPVMSSE